MATTLKEETIPFRCLTGAFAGRDDPAGLERAVTELFEAMRMPLYHYVNGMLRDSAEAEDATQEVFLRLYVELRHGRPISNGRSWLFQTAHNLAVDRLRHAGCEERLAEDKRRQPVGQANAEPATAKDERVALVRGRLGSLTAQERRCKGMRAEGLKYREIGALLGIAIPSVQNYLARAVRKLGRDRGA
jgi:RNA polymerase sigma factor (sigma-70 family)